MSLIIIKGQLLLSQLICNHGQKPKVTYQQGECIKEETRILLECTPLYKVPSHSFNHEDKYTKQLVLHAPSL